MGATEDIVTVAAGPVTCRGKFPVNIDLSQSREQRITQARFFHVQNVARATDLGKKNLADCFTEPPANTAKNVDMFTMRFDQEQTPDAVVMRLGRGVFRPATVDELIAFATKFPQPETDQNNIVALGSVCYDEDNRAYFPCLKAQDGAWTLYLERVDSPAQDAFGEFWWFAAVSK